MFVKPSLIEEKSNTIAAHYSHPAYNFERRLLRAIHVGSEPEAIKAISAKHASSSDTLTQEDIQALRDALKTSLALYAKAATDLGLAAEETRRLAQSLKERINAYSSIKALSTLEYEIALKFLNFVKRARAKKYKFPVSKVVEYIYENITEKLTLHDLADMVHLSPDYLSRLFCEELGVHITDFVLANKVESAKNLMEFSTMSITDIAVFLQFCNSAYFACVFKKFTNLTPYQYRKSIAQHH